MRKRFIYPFLAVSLSFSLGACSGATEETSSTDVSEKEELPLTHVADWSYEGETGPRHWGDLSEENAACANGNEQSPINIATSQVEADPQRENIQIQYEPTSFTLVNNGHTVKANTTSENNSMTVGGKEYKLSQFHFHTPSEHQVDGQNANMELHFVHKDTNGKIAVLGVMIEEGKESKQLASIWNQMPTEKTAGEVSVEEPIALQEILPEERTSFQYNGSLTTPPCTEEVKWAVLEQPIEMSKEQIEAFQQIFPHNNRPVQPVNDRQVYTTE